MEKVITIDDDVIHLKKDFMGWRIIKPLKNQDGSYNWKNILIGGSWLRLFIILFFIIIFLLFLNEYSGNLKIANECLEQLNNQLILYP